MRSHLLNKKFIFADETTVQVRQEQDQSSQSKSYMWVYRSGEFVEQPIAIYDYQPNRTGQCMKDFFCNYSDYLLTDSYQAYNGLENVSQAGCLAHVIDVSLEMTCRTNNIHPYFYFEHLFKMLPTHTS